MASEKIHVTATTSSDSNDDGFGDAELQGRDSHPPRVEAAPRDAFEVRLLNCHECDKTESCAEVYQPVVRSLFQRHNTLLVGRLGSDLPIRPAQWRPFRHGLRMHSCMLWRNRCGLLHGRNGLHVRKVTPAT